MQWRAYKRIRLKGFDQVVGLIDVYISKSDLHTYLVLAERHDNPAASVTNNYESYARQVCESFDLDPSRVVFMELYRDPACPHAYPYHEHETIVLHRVWLIMQSTAAATRRRPANRGLRETILRSLVDQHELTTSYRTAESWDVPGGQQGQWI